MVQGACIEIDSNAGSDDVAALRRVHTSGVDREFDIVGVDRGSTNFSNNDLVLS